ncbi:hypothetical protein CLG96_17060 [Sphingomonas oleivorans]|uniref:Uncharacterized protein n=1 Tax=Sphingomonas oleivorans TaxID=1735121 RepID=A0A2T5FUA1_9SPHN|nr:hypothetical protein CLG96_17060 [Sphingomonas oleivorans]
MGTSSLSMGDGVPMQQTRDWFDGSFRRADQLSYASLQKLFEILRSSSDLWPSSAATSIVRIVTRHG